jgi:hypothetical protein
MLVRDSLDMRCMVFDRLTPVEVAQVRSCSRALHRELNCGRVWAAAAQHVAPLKVFAAIPTAPAAALFDRLYGLTGRHNAKEFLFAFQLACERGWLAKAQWLAAHTHVHVFRRVRGFGEMKDGRLSQLWCGAASPLQRACRAGHVHVARWIAQHFGLRWLSNIGRGRLRDLLCEVSSAGHSDVVQWLVSTFIWPSFMCPADQQSIGHAALHAACEGGRTEVAVWLEARFGCDLTKPDGGGRLLVRVCAAGHLQTARWLQEKTRQPVTAMRDADGRVSIFAQACQNGHLAVAQWLVTEFRLTPCEMGGDALQWACAFGHLPVVAWLVKQCGIGAADARLTELWAQAMQRRAHTHIGRWLVARYGPERFTTFESNLGAEPRNDARPP